MMAVVRLTIMFDPENPEDAPIAQVIARLQLEQRMKQIPYGTVQRLGRAWLRRGFELEALLQYMVERGALGKLDGALGPLVQRAASETLPPAVDMALLDDAMDGLDDVMR